MTNTTLTDVEVTTILASLPVPPVGDGKALHEWAMKAVREIDDFRTEKIVRESFDFDALLRPEGSLEGQDLCDRYNGKWIDVVCSYGTNKWRGFYNNKEVISHQPTRELARSMLFNWLKTNT